ncbi:MAG: hypothetical protein UU64_C0006G0029 [candidate division WWE3 bacterium GW2011_GWF2_41_45]|nr:MAG: hypothetical protein UU55_C0005G0027 [candidate division WWE3 bacterium GW2011_GWC2_41_23]KKS10278.1 MAG: hypothetical protein UU64_C0006G0029 [candidate division WWE3 bacterium GW2011_GWF2_41_45]KKS12245.1 MAG: hypothetical protein UU68_C0003G0029 [candidate division WWE3 bacterium GW2011_GWF1_41_53]KKS20020.1 MAG: hypothetical protein UU79_C0005G0028 [candidate division WWE3 bacterium GW2011_GWE1_41_72]KKS28432.1 MAG: hypothetical protein UU86_C0002G0002 [candidate division WWE3 bacte
MLLIILLFLLPRVFLLGTDISNSDALRWHRRSDNFLQALKNQNFEKTYQRYHPGVTAMWAGAVSEQILNEYQKLKGDEIATLENAEFYPVLHALSKLVLIAILAFCFALQIYLVSKLFGSKTALLFGIIISTEPYFIGINRWFHLSSMEAMFSLNVLLLLMYFIQTNKLRFIVLSGFFAGLGLLTKMTVSITIAFSFSYILYRVFRNKTKFNAAVFYVISICVTVLVLFPALWVKPMFVFWSMYSAIVNAVFEDIRGELLTLPQKLFYYPIILLFKMSPVVLIIGVYSIINTFKRVTSKEFVLGVYLVFLVTFLTITDQKIDRYSIALFPFWILLVANTLSKLKPRILTVLLSIHVATFIWATSVYYPVYSAFINPLFGHKFVLNAGFYENSGEYFSEAAFYLNIKGRNIRTHVPNNIESFKPYYKGKLTGLLDDADYVVYSLDFDRKSFPAIKDCKIDKYFGNRLYKPVAVYACNNVSLKTKSYLVR